MPSDIPTSSPTIEPTAVTDVPSNQPTLEPTVEPTTAYPTTLEPTHIPTVSETMFLGQTPMNWSDANAYCTGLGWDLLSIHNTYTQTTAMDLCSSINHAAAGTWGCWVGLRHNESGHWAWSDTTSTDYGFTGGEPTTGDYPWSIGEPNDWNGVEDCGILYGNVYGNDGINYAWNDFACGTSNYPICRGMIVIDRCDRMSATLL